MAADSSDYEQRWVMLIYRIPREPSRPRVAVWRKLKILGALYLQDGVAVLPEDAVTHEQLEWLQLYIREAGGEASVWEASANSEAESQSLVQNFRSSQDEAYEKIISETERLRREAEMGATGTNSHETLTDGLVKLEREFRTERKRDYFRSPLRHEANTALKAARWTLRHSGGQDAAEAERDVEAEKRGET
jgi:DNA-binding transcriptional regulator PaaX